jgi:RND family efflux transporter MFP subunit
MKNALTNVLRITIPLALIVFTVVLIRSHQAGAEAPSPAAVKPVAEARAVLAEGRVSAYPGAEVVVGSDAAGSVVTMLVAERDVVRKGQLIAEIRSDDVAAALAEATARVVEADADIRLFETEAARAKHLWQEEVGSRQAYDRALRDIDGAKARRATAEATVGRLAATLDKTRVVAPIDGIVIERATDRGETVEVGDPIVTIANLDRLRIDAEVDEFDIARIAQGAPVEVTADGFDGQSWKGHVEEIPDSVVGRKLKPEDPGRLSDGRVLLVKVAFDEKPPLKLGQKVDVRISREATGEAR